MRIAATLMCSALALGCAAGAAHATVTFNEADASVNTFGDATSGNSNSYINGSGSDMATSLPVTLDAETGTSTATASSHGVVQASVTANENAYANFTTAIAGEFEFQGGEQATEVTGEASVYGDGIGDYEFTTDAAVALQIAYVLSEANPSAFADDGYQIYDVTNHTTVDATQLALNTSGSATYDLGPGEYELTLVAEENGDYDLTSPGSQTGSHDEIYTLAIADLSGAPEPSTWALMMAGVAGAGLALRRARRDAASLAV